MNRVLVVIALFLGLATSGAAAQEPPARESAVQRPTHCERASEPGTWPAVGEPAAGTDTSAVSTREARGVVRAFRRHWARVPHTGVVLRLFTECMVSSDEHFVVRRVTRATVESTLRSDAVRLAGDPSTLPNVPWAWEIYWGGASRRLVPSGPVSMFLSADLRTLLGAVQHLEG